MNDILSSIRARDNYILVVGNHPYIIQSIIDFDYLSGKSEASVVGIVAQNSGYAKYFWGNKEMLVPVYSAASEVKNKHLVQWFLNLLSGRRALTVVREMITAFKNLQGGVVFAENVPEKHSLQLYHEMKKRNLFLIGPASVGLVIGKKLKLGPIGGVTPKQIQDAYLYNEGNVAVLSASGGMTNELINLVVQGKQRLSFALSFGGDRFPLLTPSEAFVAAQNDPQTKHIIYYGELGGEDEYELIKLKHEDRVTKPVYAHIAGTVAELFPESPQFGHAKAKANKNKEKAGEKRKAMKEAGFIVSDSFADFANLIHSL